MTTLLTGLWLGVLIFQLVRLCRRRRVPVIYVPVIILPESVLAALQAANAHVADEAWLRKQLDGLGKP